MINTIYIAWRKQTGSRRYIIACLKRTAEGISFEYLSGFEDAKKDGLDYFFGFKNEGKLNQNEISNLLGLRIISKDRPDRPNFLKFWEAEHIDDNFDLLGLTQGLSPTDNFEFLADYSSVKLQKLVFITDIAALSYSQLKSGSIEVGDILSYRKEPENEYDKEAVVVFKNNLRIGYIKKIHTRLFNLDRKIKLRVKAIDENGIIKQIFVKVEK